MSEPDLPPLLPLPPADAVVPKRRSTGQSLLIGLVAGAVVGGVLASQFVVPTVRALRPLLDAGPGRGMFALLAVVTFFLVILAHEFGHVVGGLTQGFAFQLLVVGPLKVERDVESGRLRLGLNRSLELMGGIAACIPVGDHDLIRRMKWFVAGGPLASFALGLLIPIVLASPPAAWSVPAMIAGITSLALGLIASIPMPNGSFVTDGKRFLQLQRGGAEARRDVAQLTFAVHDRLGRSITDVPAALVRDSLEPVDGSMMEIVARALASSWLVAHGRPFEARPQLERAATLAKGMPFQLGAAIALERAFLAAAYDGDAATARELVAPYMRVIAHFPESERSRLDAALALAEGRREEVASHVVRGRAHLERRSGRLAGSARWTLDRLAELEQRARDAAASRA